MTKPTFHISLTLILISVTICIYAQSVNIKEFEKMPSLVKPVDYFLKKDFVLKNDSSTKTYTKVRLYNRVTREWIYLFSNKGDEDKIVEVQYFTPSSEEYGKIARSITKSGYAAIGNVRNYEKRLGSYEWHRINLKELEYIKEREYYGVVYKYFMSKELSTTPAPVNE